MITIATVLLYGVVTFRPIHVDEVVTLGVREAHYRLQPSELENAPQWTDLDQSPPLPPGKAVRVAESAIEVFTKEGKLEPLSSAFTIIQLIEEDNSVRWEMAIESFHPRLLNQGYSALKCSERESGSNIFLFGRSGQVRFVFVMKIDDGTMQDRIAFATNSGEDFSLPK